MKTYEDARLAFEFKYLMKLMKDCSGWKSKASVVSGISRMQLDRMLKRHNITVEPEGEEGATPTPS